MNILPFIKPALDIIDKVVPDKDAARKAREDLEQNVLSAVTGVMAAQNAVNEAEAKHSSVWVAGWRPGIGWVCATSLFLYFIPQFLMGAVMWTKLAWAVVEARGTELPAYPGSIESVMGLVLSMLGMGGIRMLEKKWGVARSVDPKK
jgi:hypothetical protein